MRNVPGLSKPSTEFSQLVCRCDVHAKQRTFRTLFLPDDRTPRETLAVVKHGNLAPVLDGSCCIFAARPVAVLAKRGIQPRIPSWRASLRYDGGCIPRGNLQFIKDNCQADADAFVTNSVLSGNSGRRIGVEGNRHLASSLTCRVGGLSLRSPVLGLVSIDDLRDLLQDCFFRKAGWRRDAKNRIYC